MGPINFRHKPVQQELSNFPLSARQTTITNMKEDDGRSFKMTGFEQTKNILRVAGVLLLLMMVMGASMSAQSLNPVPFPTPGVVPPPAAIMPAYQTIPAGVFPRGKCSMPHWMTHRGCATRTIIQLPRLIIRHCLLAAK